MTHFISINGKTRVNLHLNSLPLQNCRNCYHQEPLRAFRHLLHDANFLRDCILVVKLKLVHIRPEVIVRTLQEVEYITIGIAQG